MHTLLIPYLIFNMLCIAAPLAGADNPARNPDALPVFGWFWDSVTYNAGAENWLGFSLQLFYPENVPLWSRPARSEDSAQYGISAEEASRPRL